MNTKKLLIAAPYILMALEFVLARMREPSTYAGIVGWLALVGIHLSDVQVNALIQALIAAASFAAVLLPETGTHKS